MLLSQKETWKWGNWQQTLLRGFARLIASLLDDTKLSYENL